MSKKKRTKKANMSGSSTKPIEFTKKGLAVLCGLVVGTAINKFIAKKDAVNGTDLLGLDGQTSKYTTPAITTAVGVAGGIFIKNPLLKFGCMGVAAAGGAGLLNAATGKSLVSLNGDDEYQQPVILPGINGDVPTFDELPTENELATQYNPDLTPVGDVEFEDVEGIFGTDGGAELL